MKKRKTFKKILSTFLIIVLILIFTLYLIRLINPTEIDDVSPNIPCPEINIYNPDTLYVIPNYESKPISYYPEWCKSINSLNKNLALHGLNHTYQEFLYENITQEQLDKGIKEFEECFGYEPNTFKPPQLKISEENKKLVKENNLKFKGLFNQIIHKVYHCDDSDKIPNRIIKIF